MLRCPSHQDYPTVTVKCEHKSPLSDFVIFNNYVTLTYREGVQNSENGYTPSAQKIFLHFGLLDHIMK